MELNNKIRKVRNNSWSKEEDNLLINNYSEFGIEYCVNLLKNRSKSAILNRAITFLKLKLNNNTKSKILHLAKKNINIDVNKFTNVNDKEVAYILGFLWADGNIYHNKMNHNISLKINYDDSLDIENTFNFVGKWGIYKRKTKWKDIRVFLTNNKTLYDFLYKFGYDKKSYISPDNIVKFIPNTLQMYFFRGYFDGDGCFYYNKKNNLKQMTITSSYNQDWLFIENIYKKFNITYTIKRINGKKSKYSIIRVTNKKSIESFGNFIYFDYENDKIGLKRKYKKYKEIIL